MVSEPVARMADGRITPEMIESMRAKAGTLMRIDHSINNEEATRLAIAKFVDAIGDTNPLWRDDSYAAASPYGGPVAPPSWVICCFSGIQFGWPGLGSFHVSSELEFYEPVRRGDVIAATCMYNGFDGPKVSSFADQVVIDHFTNEYRNQHDRLVARIRWDVLNFERGAARTKAREFATPLPHPWTEDEVRAIEGRVLAERRRGPKPRWWNDAVEGEPLAGITKGPLGLTDAVAYVAAGGAPIPRLAAHRASLEIYARHPAWSFRDPETGASEPIYAVHYSKAAARGMGVPLPYDVGFQRQCWQIHFLTEWAGDHGWVKKASASYRRFVYLADVVELGGRVERSYVDDDGDACVDVSTYARNQRGEDVMPGRATIALPTREGAHPVRSRLR